MANKKYYYVTGNTSKGLMNFLPSNVEDFNQIIILKHPSHQLKTNVIKNIIKNYEQYDLEVLLSTLGYEFIEGVIIREISVAVIMDRIATPDLPGAIELDLGLFLQHPPFSTIEITDAKKNFENYTQIAYDNFETGLKIHDNLEAIYIGEMDFNKADLLTEEFIRKMLSNAKKKNSESKIYRRLFGTNTKDGPVNEVPHIIEPISSVFHIKGRAGTGKSTFMKKVIKACKEYGLDMELYYCSFDPDSIDMVMVRELDFCLFDSTDPHEFFPEREGEVVIDLYKETVTPGTDEKFAAEIQEVNTNYKSYMKKAIQDLKKAGHYLEKEEEAHTFSESETNSITAFITEKIVD